MRPNWSGVLSWLAFAIAIAIGTTAPTHREGLLAIAIGLVAVAGIVSAMERTR